MFNVSFDDGETVALSSDSVIFPNAVLSDADIQDEMQHGSSDGVAFLLIERYGAQKQQAIDLGVLLYTCLRLRQGR